MRILCVHDKSQYGLMNAFLDAIADGMESAGHDIVRADLADARADPPAGLDLVFSLGALGADGDWNVPLLTWLVDNPVWSAEHLAHLDPDRDGVMVVAGEHVAVLNEFLGFPVPTGFVPHGITVDASAPPAFDDAERDIDVLVAGSFQPRPAPPWTAPEGPVHDTVTMTLALADERWKHHMRELEVGALFSEAAATNGLAPVAEGHRMVAPVLAWLDGNLRDRRRLACVQTLDAAGVRIHLVGAGWEHAPNLEHAEVLGPVDHTEVFALAKRAKVLLNAGPPFFNHGWHERIPLAMATGALAVTETNDYLGADVRVAPLIDVFTMPELDAMPDVVRAAVADPRRSERTARAYAIARDHHSWANRAATLLQMVEV